MTNDTQTLTLAEFLLARIAEDETRYSTDPSEYGYGHEFRMAECEAKRQVVEWCTMPVAGTPEAQYGWAALGEAIMPTLALPYADHPDYREEWKP